MVIPGWRYLVSGGTTGQALTKISGADGDYQWSTVAAVPGGSTTQIQYNNAGAFGGSANLTWTAEGLIAVGGSGTYLASLTGKMSNGNPSFQATETPGSYAAVKFGDVNQAQNITVFEVYDVAGLISFSCPAGYCVLGDPYYINTGAQFIVDALNSKTTSNVKHEASGNITVMTNGQGLHQQSPDGNYWRQDVSNLGVATWTNIGASPP